MENLELIYSDYSYTVYYKDLGVLLERLEELQEFMKDLINLYVLIDTIDYIIDATEQGYIITFYGKGYIKANPREVFEPSGNTRM